MICMMCVRPVNYGIAFSCNNSPKLLTWIISVFAYTQEINLERHVDLFAVLAKRGHLLFIYFFRPRVPDHIRVSKI